MQSLLEPESGCSSELENRETGDDPGETKFLSPDLSTLVYCLPTKLSYKDIILRTRIHFPAGWFLKRYSGEEERERKERTAFTRGQVLIIFISFAMYLSSHCNAFSQFINHSVFIVVPFFANMAFSCSCTLCLQFVHPMLFFRQNQSLVYFVWFPFHQGFLMIYLLK